MSVEVTFSAIRETVSQKAFPYLPQLCPQACPNSPVGDREGKWGIQTTIHDLKEFGPSSRDSFLLWHPFVVLAKYMENALENVLLRPYARWSMKKAPW